MSRFSTRLSRHHISQADFERGQRTSAIALSIHQLQDTDIDEASNILSQAFVDNPIQMAVYQSRRSHAKACIKQNFRAILSDRNSQTFVAKLRSPQTIHAGPPIVGLYRVKRCTGRPFCRLRHAPDIQTLSIAEREESWLESWASHDPMTPHSHLGPIGVAPAFQHQGVGKQLLRHYCQQLDRDGLAAYLEADKWQNVGLYESFGFQMIEQAQVMGIQNYFMWRNAISEK